MFCMQFHKKARLYKNYGISESSEDLILTCGNDFWIKFFGNFATQNEPNYLTDRDGAREKQGWNDECYCRFGC